MKNSNVLLFVFIFLLLSVWLNFYLFSKISNNNSEDLNNNRVLANSTIYLPQNLQTELWNENINSINIFQKSLEEFEKINNYWDFEKWDNVYGTDLFLWFIIKNKDKNLYKKYFKYLYEKYFSINDLEFINDMKKFSIQNSDDFSNYMLEYFDLLINSKITKLSEIDYEWWDIFISFNNLNISDAIESCKILKEKFSDKYLNDSNSCEDKIYNFRANSENKYCEKIFDPYKARLCSDFLKYSNQ